MFPFVQLSDCAVKPKFIHVVHWCSHKQFTMSIYSGFATRQQEQSYDQLVQDLIYVLQKRMMKFYQHEQAEEIKFLEALTHLHTSMLRMEQHKYLEPKTSKSFEQLLKYLATNTPGGTQYYKGSNRLSSRKQSMTVPLKASKIKAHKQSLHCLIPEPNSVGKIIRQINSNDTQISLAASYNTFINPTANNHQLAYQSKEEGREGRDDSGGKNGLEEHARNHERDQERIKTGRQLGHENMKEKPRDFLISYLEKTKEHFRKRQIRNGKFAHAKKDSTSYL